MKKIIFGLMMILGITSNLFAWEPDPWTTQDTVLQGSLVSLSIIDYCQTLEYVKYPERGIEQNPLIGEHPTRKRMILFGATTLTIHTGIAYLLPKQYRTTWQMIGVSIEGFNVMRNFQVSAAIYYPWE